LGHRERVYAPCDMLRHEVFGEGVAQPGKDSRRLCVNLSQPKTRSSDSLCKHERNPRELTIVLCLID